MAFKQKYRIRYYDIKFNILWDARLLFLNYEDDLVFDFVYSENPIQYEAPSVEASKVSPIKGISIILGFYNLTFEQYTNDFLSASRKRIRLDLYKDGAIYWKGFFVPDSLTEPYLPGPNLVSLEFNDGLGLLKNEVYKNGDLVYFGFKSLLAVIWECLDKTGLGLNLEESTYFYDATMNQTEEDSPLDQTYCTSEGFIESDEEITCYEVLKRILEIQVARLYQKNGVWHITPIMLFKEGYVSRVFLYSSIGFSYNSTEFRNSYVIISNGMVQLSNLNAFTERSQIRKVDKALKLIKITQDYGLDDNVIWNGGFKYWDETYPARPLGFRKGGGATFTIGPNYQVFWNTRLSPSYLDYIRNSYTTKVEIKTGFHIKIEISYTHPYSIEKTYVEWQCRIIGTTSTRVLQDDGKWSVLGNRMMETLPASNTNGSGTISIETDPLPQTGYIEITIYAPHSSEANKIIYIDEISVTFARPYYDSIKEENSMTTIIDEDNDTKWDDIKIFLGDIPDIGNEKTIYRNGLFILDEDDEYQITTAWNRRGESSSYELINLIAEEIVLLYNKHRWRLSGNMIGHIDIGSRYIASDGRIYIIDSISNFDLKISRADLVLLEITQSALVADGWMEWTDSSGYVEWTDSEGYVEPTN